MHQPHHPARHRWKDSTVNDIGQARARRLIGQQAADGNGGIIDRDQHAAAVTIKHRVLSALQQALGEPVHVSNTGIGPGAAAWVTLIVDGPYYVDITVRPAATDNGA
jgi:hypothetical protein